MDWIHGIQRALDYTEEHLTEKIDYDEVAKKAYSSSFHFQRMFTLVCGFSLADYIRMRRLTLAAEELYRTNKKVIDVSLKYGYESPESFTRAFTKFHGITPSDAKNGENIKSFSRLFVKLTLLGGNIMDYRIEKKKAIKVLCKKIHVNKPQNEMASEDISKFWNKCSEDGTIEKISKYGNYENLNGLLGICFISDRISTGFPYGIGVEYNGKEIEDNEFEIVEIPEYTYAVFTSKGKMPEAFKETYKKIVTEFFPQNNYEYNSGVELEVYPSENIEDEDYTCEIWISVKEK